MTGRGGRKGKGGRGGGRGGHGGQAARGERGSDSPVAGSLLVESQRAARAERFGHGRAEDVAGPSPHKSVRLLALPHDLHSLWATLSGNGLIDQVCRFLIGSGAVVGFPRGRGRPCGPSRRLVIAQHANDGGAEEIDLFQFTIKVENPRFSFLQVSIHKFRETCFPGLLDRAATTA